MRTSMDFSFLRFFLLLPVDGLLLIVRRCLLVFGTAVRHQHVQK